MSNTIATTPKPPYYAVIFTSLSTEGDRGYGHMADRMVELAAQQPGFLGVESARTTDGLGITVSYWSSGEAIAAWKAHAPLEPTLRQLQPVNDRRAQLARQLARAGNHQIAAFYRRFNSVGVHARQSHKNEDCAGRLQDVNRWLPGRQS